MRKLNTTSPGTPRPVKCTEDHLLLAGPQRNKLVCASADDGKLMWTQPTGNWQLVLREDAVYAAGPQGAGGGVGRLIQGPAITMAGDR